MVTVTPSGSTTAAVTYTPIATQTISSAIVSVTFTNIPATYKDLVLVGSFATNDPSSLNLYMGTGSIDTGSNYSWSYITGNGTTQSSSRGSTDTRIFTGATSTGNLQGMIIVNFQNYSNTNTYKTTLSRLNNTSPGPYETVGLWQALTAINQIQLAASGNLLISSSVFTLYGIGA